MFTVAEANALLPRVEEAFAKLDRLRERLVTIKKSKLDVLEMIHGREIMNVEGPDKREYEQCLIEVEAIRKEYEAGCGAILEMGGYVKSVETGLVDFYGVIEGRLVWLCWKRGEGSIEHYHHLEDGFTGRRPIKA